MRKFKVNDKIRIKTSVSPYGDYRLYKGEVGKIISYYGRNSINIKLECGKKFFNVGLSVIEHYDNNNNSKTSKDRLIESINKKKEEINSLLEKLKFLEETNQTNFNENEFKAYKTLKNIEEENLTLYEKSVKIAELLK